MRVIFLLMLVSFSSFASWNNIVPVMDACLHQKNIGPAISYSPVDTSEVMVDDNYHSLGSVRLFSIDNVDVGYTAGKKPVSIIYSEKAIVLNSPIQVKLDVPYSYHPDKIDFSLSDWGVITDGQHQYVCVNAPFSSVGESGRYQNYRSLFVFEISENINMVYYSVGDLK